MTSTLYLTPTTELVFRDGRPVEVLVTAATPPNDEAVRQIRADAAAKVGLSITLARYWLPRGSQWVAKVESVLTAKRRSA